MTENIVCDWLDNPMTDYRVVIIEDQFLIALDLEEAVSSSGLSAAVVGFASDRENALRIGVHADIAFVDVNLADGASGPDIGRRLARERGVMVIFMTANPEMLDNGVAGTLGVLSKPVAASVVRQALSYAIARRNGALAAVPDGMSVFAG